MTEHVKGGTTGERLSWASPSRIEVAVRSPDRLAIKYRYHLLSEGRAICLRFLGLVFIGLGLIAIATGIIEIVIGGIFLGVLVLVLTWFYPRQYRNIEVNKKTGEISFSDSSLFSDRLPMSIPFELVKCLTVASQTIASKPENMFSVTLNPTSPGQFNASHLTRLLVRSYSSDDIEELARIVSEYSDIRVVRQ